MSDDPFSRQVGGGHYADMPVQPARFHIRNDLRWAEGEAIQHILRWRTKDGIRDLEKAVHIITLLIAEARAGKVPGWEEER